MNRRYDVIIQPGHFPRRTGATGGEGKFTTEQHYAAWISSIIVADLRRRSVNAILIPADGFTPGLNTKIFLALHTDSSSFPCRVGPSIGYEKVSDGRGMHGIALALALSLDIDPMRFMTDNYTVNLGSYYAYRQVNAEMFKGLLEMSELSCPEDEAKLLANGELLGRNLSKAIVFALRNPRPPSR